MALSVSQTGNSRDYQLGIIRAAHQCYFLCAEMIACDGKVLSRNNAILTKHIWPLSLLRAPWDSAGTDFKLVSVCIFVDLRKRQSQQRDGEQ